MILRAATPRVIFRRAIIRYIINEQNILRFLIDSRRDILLVTFCAPRHDAPAVTPGERVPRDAGSMREPLKRVRTMSTRSDSESIAEIR